MPHRSHVLDEDTLVQEFHIDSGFDDPWDSPPKIDTTTKKIGRPTKAEATRRRSLPQSVEAVPMSQMDTPRCPLCRHVLVVRQGPEGPGFFCDCPPLPKRRRGDEV